MTLQHQKDRQVVRRLAEQVAELAASDEYETRRRRWRDVNGLRKPDRAPVWCRPAGAWKEILPDDAIESQDPLCRDVERTLRQHLFKDEVGDDHIVDPWWEVPAVFDCDTEHTWGLPTQRLVASTSLGGWRYDPPVKRVEDYERLTIPTFTYNPQKTQEALSRMDDLLGEILPVRLACGPPLGAHLSVYLDQLRGMSGMLEDLAFHPKVVHRVMALMLEGVLRSLRAAEETGLLTPNNHQPMTCSDPIGSSQDGKTRLCDLWASSNSQEFQEVSPAMWEEFLLNYQIPIFQQFGLVQYGCCEDLSRKIRGLLRIPNLRVFVCSYWTDLDRVVEACGTQYTIMWRQLSAHVTVSYSADQVRGHLREGMRKLKGHYYQIVLREIETLGGDPKRLHAWARTAREVAEEMA